MNTTVTVDPGEWSEAVATVAGPQLVIGGPGTGKTEFLVRRAVHLLTELGTHPGQITVLGFSRRGVAEVRRRIRSNVSGTLGVLDIATFHSFAARLIEHDCGAAGWEENPQILTGPEQVALVHQLLGEERPEDWSPAFAQVLNTRTFAGEVTDFILRAAEQMETPDSIRERDRADWRGLPGFLQRYQEKLRLLGRIDYGTLIATAVPLIESGAIDLGDTGHFVLVDEYQDTTVAQVCLLRAMQNHGSNILAAADPYQSIYSFRGATVENVAAFDSDFGTASNPALHILLTTSFRTPAAILRAAEEVTAGNLPGATGPVVPAPGSGVVEAYRFDQQVEEADWIAAEAQRLHLVEGIPYSKIGVFVRSKRRLLADLSRALERRQVPHELPGSRLTDQPAVRFLLDLAVAASACDGPIAAEQALRRVMLGSRVGLTIGRFRSLELRSRILGSWVPAIREHLPEWQPLADLIENADWATSSPAIEGMWRVWSSLPGIEEMVHDPTAAEERSAWRSLAQVLTRWEERNPNGTLLDYRRLAESEDFEAQPLLSYRRPEGDRLALTTLHQAKGLELDVVFIADAVDGVFPDLRSRDSLLGVRHLLRHVPAETAEYRVFRLQEESRLAYTAMTRARRRVVWTATERGLDEGPGRLSRFFSKIASSLDGTPGRPPGRIQLCTPLGPGNGARPPVTPHEAEAALRRCLVDVGAPRPARLAALHLLSEGQTWGIRSPSAFSGVVARGPNTGLMDAEPILSPSQAQLYEECPRRYALERRLRVGSDTSLHASFGILIHDVLEHAERRAMLEDRAHAVFDEAFSELEHRFDPEEFGGPPFAESWFVRGVAGLERLYDKWPARQRRAVALERELVAEVGGVSWTGRADRIDKSDRGLTIVDYKTSKSAPPLAEAAGSLQLGFYALAAGRDEQLAGLGPVIGAELWYPMKDARSVTIRQFDMAKLDDVQTRLEAVAAGIRSEDWGPHPGDHCGKCSLRQACPAWPEGGPDFA